VNAVFAGEFLVTVDRCGNCNGSQIENRDVSIRSILAVMKHVIEAGTDVAWLLLFDPKALPADFDAVFAEDPTELLDRLQEEGRLFHVGTGADGAYLLHAFVEEEVDEKLLPHLRDSKCSDSFEVAGESVYFTGAECGFREDDLVLKTYPNLGGSFPVRNGTYHVKLFRTEYPGTLVDKVFQERVTSLQYRWRQIFDWLMPLCVLSVFVALLSVFFVSWRSWFTIVLPIASSIPVLTAVLSQLPVFRKANAMWETVQREFPSIVATFRAKEMSGH
jgi:hypothetical protein